MADDYLTNDILDAHGGQVPVISFGEALEALKHGGKATRAGWREKGSWLTLVTNWNGNVTPGTEQFRLSAFICLRTASADIVPWQPIHNDLLANDWMLLSAAI